MNFKMMGRFISLIIAIEALFMLPALGISIGFRETLAVHAFLITIGVILIVSGILYLLCRKANRLFGAREGLACVAVCWIVMSLLGALPFTLSGQVPRYIDALFEIVSGFTTTGSSVIANVEGLYRGILYWRSFSHWIGGMGVLVFLLAIVPGTKGAGFTMHLLRAESPGPDVGKLVPRMRQTALILYLIYVVLTVVNFLFLVFGNLDWLSALCIAFGTAGTGGFGVANDSLASATPYVQNVTTIFMFLFGINFGFFYLLLLKQFRSAFRDEELRFYVGFALLCVIALVFSIRPLYGTLSETIRHAAFQVSSIMTTTGFATTDFDQWPGFSKCILLVLMVIGACAGSTGGGLKCLRVLLLFKVLRRNIRQIMNPQKVLVIRSNDKVVDEKVLTNVNAYLAAYVIILILGTLLVSIDGFGLETSLTAILATFNNIGPGLAAVGPTCTFANFSGFSKFIMIFCMLAGRLEIFPMLVLFSRGTWYRK